jgi:protein-tyrosine-phosphatase
MAQEAFKSKIPKYLRDSIEVASAGLNTLSGLPPTAEAALAARLKGYDLSKHRSQKAVEETLEQYDIILCMEPEQTRYLKDRHPLLKDRVFTLKAFGGKKEMEIPDPFGTTPQKYIETLDLIDRELIRIRPIIVKAAKAKILKPQE